VQCCADAVPTGVVQGRDQMLLHGIWPTKSGKAVSGGPAGKLCSSACDEEHNTTNERHSARDGRQRNVVCLFACSVNRSDVNELFPGGVRKTSPRKTEQTECNQDYSKRLGHGDLLWQRHLAVTEQSDQCPQVERSYVTAQRTG